MSRTWVHRSSGSLTVVDTFRRAVICGVMVVIAWIILPPAIAPFVSDHPILWTYRVHSPMMYRYPAVILRASNTFDVDRLALRFVGRDSRVQAARRTIAIMWEHRAVW
jgi:hypothetical protein